MKNMKRILIVMLVSVNVFLFSQVGINTNEPNEDFSISIGSNDMNYVGLVFKAPFANYDDVLEYFKENEIEDVILIPVTYMYNSKIKIKLIYLFPNKIITPTGIVLYYKN